MGFNSVYRVLQDLFPQVDTRLLRAVAIENSKDADTAVEVVLMEVMPYLSKGTTASDTTAHDLAVEDACPGPAKDALQLDSTYLNETAETSNGSPYSTSNGGNDPVCKDDGHKESASAASEGKDEKSNVEVGPDVTSLVMPIDRAFRNSADNHCNLVHTQSEEIISLQELSSVKVGSDQDSHVSSILSKHERGCTNGVMSGNQLADSEDFGWLCTCGFNMVVDPPIQDCIPDAPEGGLQLAVVTPLIVDHEKPESSGASDDVLKNDVSSGELVDFEDEFASNTVVTRSGQICRIDLLEDIIEDARNNKKILFDAMESVITLMKEVELQEKAAEQAKEEVVRGGLDIVSRVEDLKQMLQHAKDANNMHAGEVYGERAILATEVKELQSRLLSLSDERDKSLAILNEMRQTIEERLDAAEKERKAADQDKMEKEESARNALAEQELIMEKVVEESKMLKQEAEENSKLQEFLMDRGRVVDVLQGEISVICQDVKLLKEKFDERVPLSKSLSSSQTTCILASSSSSLKSLAADQVPEQAESSKTPKKTSPSPSVDDQLSSGGEDRGDDLKALSDDDGWEFFDDHELCK